VQLAATFIISMHFSTQCKTEELAFTSIVKWTKHDVEQRREVFPDLLKNVKLHLLPSRFLEEVVFAEVSLTVVHFHAIIFVKIQKFLFVLRLALNLFAEVTLLHETYAFIIKNDHGELIRDYFSHEKASVLNSAIE